MLRYSADFFHDRGFKLYCLSTGETRGEYADKLKREGYTVFHLPFRKSIGYFLQLYNLINRHGFDVVHIHSERGYFLHALIAQMAGCPCIVRTIHSVFQFSNLLRIQKMIERGLVRILFKIRIITISKSVQENEAKRFAQRSTLIYNWVDSKVFYPVINENEKWELRSQYGINENEFIIISVGSCIPVKNHADILKALKQVLQSCPNVLYIHVGTGELLEAEKDLTKKLCIEDRVKFFKPTEIIRPVLAMSDVFIMPSDYEGFGLAALEALFCGLQIIAYSSSGLNELLINDFGFSIPHSYIKLGESICYAANNYADLIKLPKEYDTIIRNIYNKEKNLLMLLENYKLNYDAN